jgi:hypothetical protein
MTDENMALLALIQKSDDGDFLKTVAEAALQRIMDYDPRRMSAVPTGRPIAMASESGRWKPGWAAWS